MTTLHAQPYDLAASGFYFDSAESYAAQAASDQCAFHASTDWRVTGRSPAAATAFSRRGRASKMTALPLSVRAALPSCSSKISPPDNPLSKRAQTESTLLLRVSKPRRVQLANRRSKRVNTGSRNGFRKPAGARKNLGRAPVIAVSISWAADRSSSRPAEPSNEKSCRWRSVWFSTAWPRRMISPTRSG